MCGLRWERGEDFKGRFMGYMTGVEEELSGPLLHHHDAWMLFLGLHQSPWSLTEKGDIRGPKGGEEKWRKDLNKVD